MIDLMGGIKNEGYQIELENTIPWIDDLDIRDVFKDEDEEERVGIMDFINGLVEILRLEIEELQVIVWEAFAPIKPWDEG